MKSEFRIEVVFELEEPHVTSINKQLPMTSSPVRVIIVVTEEEMPTSNPFQTTYF
jgi:hypothetical protein